MEMSLDDVCSSYESQIRALVFENAQLKEALRKADEPAGDEPANDEGAEE